MSMASAQFLVQNADAVAEMAEKVTATDTAMEQAAVRTDTVQQMMARCRAKVDDLKIGFFEFSGSLGGYATILAEQAVTVSQLVPLFNLFGKTIKFVGNQEKMRALWTGISSTATSVATGVMWLFNAALWANPITWVVACIVALIAAIVVCMTKVEGWGEQWDSIVKFMKLSFRLNIETVKWYWNSLIDGIMIGLDKIKLGWYKFKEAVGMGDSARNQEMISRISADIDRRKTEIIEGAKKVKELAVEAGNALEFKLSWKKKEPGKDETKDALGVDNPVKVPVVPTVTGGGLDLDFSNKGKKDKGSASKPLDLDKIVPDLKGSTDYAAISARMAPVNITTPTPEVPDIPQAVVNVAAPEVPEIPQAIINIEVPEIPEIPQAIVNIATPQVPELPEVPQGIVNVAAPQTPEVPQNVVNVAAPQMPEVPGVPQSVVNMAAPELPEVPQSIINVAAPKVPEVPKSAVNVAAPEVPEVPQSIVNVAAPAAPEVPKALAPSMRPEKINPLRSMMQMAASIALPLTMPLTVAATTLPQEKREPQREHAQTEFRADNTRRGGVTMEKYCDSVVINIAKPDGAGMDEIERRIRKTIEEVLEDHA